MSHKIFIGNDIVHIPRFLKSLEKEAFVEKVFHPTEIDYCKKKQDSASSFAARFAAKEAFSKAFGTGLYVDGVYPLDVWVKNDTKSGKPCLCFSEKLEAKLSDKGITGFDVSLAHHGDYALAHVVLFG